MPEKRENYNNATHPLFIYFSQILDHVASV